LSMFQLLLKLLFGLLSFIVLSIKTSVGAAAISYPKGKNRRKRAAKRLKLST